MAASESGPANDRHGERPPGAPRWMKIMLISALVVVVVAVVATLVFGVEHGPVG